MTYCVGMRLDDGLVFMSDTRTGEDHFAVSTEMFPREVPNARSVSEQDRCPSFLRKPTMFQVARLVAETLRDAFQLLPSNTL